MKRLPTLAALALGLTVVPAIAAQAAAPAPPPASSKVAPSSALYLIAGMFYGDPDGNEKAGVITFDSSVTSHIKRNAISAGTLTQLTNAVSSLGGVDTRKGNEVTFRLPAHTTLQVNLAGSVSINGRDALNLKVKHGVWTTSATSSQAAAFLAGYIQGEGSTKGLVGDDPSAAHLMLVAHLMATSSGLDVPTKLVPNATGKFNRLYVGAQYWQRVQHYPFAVWHRCPGGAPKTQR